MPKVVITAQVEDAMKWEKGFRTHGSLFKSQTVLKRITLIPICHCINLQGPYHRCNPSISRL